MADTFDQKTRSWVMSRVRSKGTKPELIVRSLLHREGLRFSLKRKDLPGQPDIVLPKYRTVIFVHGCFWHRHAGCKRTTMPATRMEFWENKFNKTIARDAAAVCGLRNLGWQVVVLWECEIIRDPIGTVDIVVARLLGTASHDNSRTRSQVLHDANARLQYELGKRTKLNADED